MTFSAQTISNRLVELLNPSWGLQSWEKKTALKRDGYRNGHRVKCLKDYPGLGNRWVFYPHSSVGHTFTLRSTT